MASSKQHKTQKGSTRKMIDIRNYIRNIAPTPLAYQKIRNEAIRNKTDVLNMDEINLEIAAHRKKQK